MGVVARAQLGLITVFFHAAMGTDRIEKRFLAHELAYGACADAR
jgi:hypothetical protein